MGLTFDGVMAIRHCAVLARSWRSHRLSFCLFACRKLRETGTPPQGATVHFSLFMRCKASRLVDFC
jgi:hypothetical protein